MNDWDSTTINVVTDDDYYDIELWSCLRCGSLVKQEFKETHEKWHQETEGGWQIPGDLAERVSKADYRDAWGLEIKRTAEVRAILQDLIAELQDASTGYDPDCQSGCGVVPGAGCPTHYEQAVERAADRAEQRLREVSGE